MTLKFLVADDHDFVRATTVAALNKLGEITCLEAEDGNIALNLATQEDDIDLILLDIEMPGMNGFEVCKALKENSQRKSIPIIFLTGRDNEKDVQQGIDLGAYYYLTKPAEKTVLQSVVKAALQDKNNQKQLQDNINGFVSSLGMLKSAHFEFTTPDQARMISALLAKACPDPENHGLGLLELMMNAVEHGNLGITYDEKTALNNSNRLEEEIARRLESPDYKDRKASVTLEIGHKETILHIFDEGDGFDHKDYMDFSSERAFDNHGRGIAIANQMSFDNVCYQGCGNHVMVSIVNT